MTFIVKIGTCGFEWISERSEDLRDLFFILIIGPVLGMTRLDDRGGNFIGAILLALFTLVLVALFAALLVF